MNILALRYFLFLVFAMGVSSTSHAMVVVQSATATPVSKDEVKNIFLGTKTAWEDGSRIRAVILDSESLLDSLCRDFLDTTPDRYLSLWRKKLFTGRAIPPKSVKSVDELLQFLRDQPKAVGILSEPPSGSTLRTMPIP